MLYPIDHAWGPATPVILEEEETEKKMPVEEEDDVPEPPTRTLKNPIADHATPGDDQERVYGSHGSAPLLPVAGNEGDGPPHATLTLARHRQK